MSHQLLNYAHGQWVAGTGPQSELLDASTGELVATTSSGGPACRQAGSTSPPCSTTPGPWADRSNAILRRCRSKPTPAEQTSAVA
ncbi:MAG: hypothetical protein IPK70_11415 [Flavobacteriales bacterium]|nr:hypothetical protein [Flavobacteriales bacterium]